MNAVCVYCGSSVGALPVYLEATRDLARTLAGRGLRVVCGGLLMADDAEDLLAKWV